MASLQPEIPDIPSTSRPVDNAHGQSNETFFHLQSLEAQALLTLAVPHLISFSNMLGFGESCEEIQKLLKGVDTFYREQERCWATGRGWRSTDNNHA